MICIKDNTLSEEDIGKLLIFTTHPMHEFAESFTIDIDSNNPLVNKIKDQAVEKDKFKQIELAQIVTYPTGSSLHFHFDEARETTTGASITFLNDGFVGGEAALEAIKISPLTGRTYYFDGKMYKHGLLNVIKGVRHTLSVWYKNG